MRSDSLIPDDRREPVRRYGGASWKLLLVAPVLVALWMVVIPALGEDLPRVPLPEVQATERAMVESAVERGLVRLAQSQRGDGSFGPGESRLESTALAVRVFVAAGYPPGQGRFAIVVSDAEAFLLGQYPRPNLAIETEAMLALTFSHLLGVETREDRRTKLQAALSVSVTRLLGARSASSLPQFAGGWARDRDALGASLSATAWCILSLKSAEATGVQVPRSVYEAAADFALRCRRSDGRFGDTTARPSTDELNGDEPSGSGATVAGALILGLVSPADAVAPEAATAMEALVKSPPLYSDLLAVHLSRLYKSPAARRLSVTLTAGALATQGKNGLFADPSALLALVTPWGLAPPLAPASR